MNKETKQNTYLIGHGDMRYTVVAESYLIDLNGIAIFTTNTAIVASFATWDSIILAGTYEQ